MVGWHHPLNRHEFEQTPGESGGHRSLVCCSPWCHKEVDMTVTEQHNKLIRMAKRLPHHCRQAGM